MVTQGHFVNDEHALACGMILGALMKPDADGQRTIDDARPFYDSQGNYTNQTLVRIGNRHYTVTVEESISEATLPDEPGIG